MRNQIPFKKPKELLELEPQITKLLKKHHLDARFTVEDLELLIYNCYPSKEFEVFNPVLKYLKTPEAYEEVLLTLQNQLWNATPLKMLGGEISSPNAQTAEPKSRDS